MVDYLKSEFERRSRKNPRYSLRAFARLLEVDPSTLSALMNGKRPLRPKTVAKLLDKIELDNPNLRAHFINAASGFFQGTEPEYIELRLEQFAAISQWEHFAILSLMEIPQFRATPRNVSTRLNIPIATTITALSRLAQLGFIKKVGSHYQLEKSGFTTPTDTPSAILRQANREYIEKALSSLEETAVENRDITGITMAIDPTRLPQAKKVIRNFRRELAAFLEKGSRSEVYRLNVQLFPLTKMGEKK